MIDGFRVEPVGFETIFFEIFIVSATADAKGQDVRTPIKKVFFREFLKNSWWGKWDLYYISKAELIKIYSGAGHETIGAGGKGNKQNFTPLHVTILRMSVSYPLIICHMILMVVPQISRRPSIDVIIRPSIIFMQSGFLS